MVLHRDHLRAVLREQLRGHRSDIAESLQGHARAFDLHAEAARRLAADEIDAATGGLLAPQRSAQRHRLAGDHAGDRGADIGRVGIHHPRHHLGVGVDVGRGDVARGTDDDADLAGVAAGEPFQLLARQLLRIDTDAALGAAEGQVHRGILDGHPAGQRHHLFERDVGVVTQAALAGATRQAVLHAIALEMRHAAIVEFHRHVDDQRPLRARQRADPAFQVTEVGADAIDLRQESGPRTAFVVGPHIAQA